ncbi:MAG: 16S rRNA (guanine(527)-N(7))-methyltransferase RsmG [Deltaproteobacteria bacterium]|nr:16S rRNA (guanine(527)-N(7))-methyltransferase RsmG [Deltaproteobacteria bacterium]
MGREGWALIAPVLAREGIGVSPEQRTRLERYVELLLHWGRRINLTAARDPQTVFTRHILDALMLERLPWPQPAARWVDLGAGGGFPGMVFAVMHPELQVTAVETVAKKITFLQQTARELGLAHYHPLRMDAQKFADSAQGAGTFDVVLARAFADLETVLDLGARLVRPGGEVWAMKGQRLAEEQQRLSGPVRKVFNPQPKLYAYEFPEWSGEGVVAVYRRETALG